MWMIWLGCQASVPITSFHLIKRQEEDPIRQLGLMQIPHEDVQLLFADLSPEQMELVLCSLAHKKLMQAQVLMQG